MTLRNVLFVASLAAAAHSATAQQGSYVYLGTDCGPAQIQAVGVPTLGTTFQVQVTRDTSFVDGPLSWLLTGVQALPVPIDIGAITGHQPCGFTSPQAFCGLLYSSIEDSVRAFGAGLSGGLATVGFVIPSDPGLIGFTFFQHNLTVGSGFGTACVDLSRVGIGVIGT